METRKDTPTDDASVVIDIHKEDSTIYLFGSELYCGWCLESFTCPVRLKIHCCLEHLAICSCGRQFSDKQSLCDHVVDSDCLLPPPFQWYHFLNLPVRSKLSDIHISEESEGEAPNELLHSEATNEEASNKLIKGLDESIQKTNAKPAPDRAKDRLVFWDSKYASASCTRSCPTCSRSFSVVSKYIHHRAVCRAKCKGIPNNVAARRHHHLINFCEPAPNGRWKCKLCMRSTAHRGDLYKHIRAKHKNIQRNGGHVHYLINFCEPAPDGRWKCKLCTQSAAHRGDLYKHIRAKHSEVLKTQPNANTKPSLKVNSVENITMSPKKHAAKTEAGKEPLFCCVLCPFQSIRKYDCRRHIQQMHGKKSSKYLYPSGCNIASEITEGCTTESNKEVIGAVYKTVAINEVNLDSTPAEKTDGENLSLTSLQSCCDKHRSDDVQFIVSCFSSPVAGSPLSCKLCGDQFGDLEKAAVHVYNSHISAVQEWRDSRDTRANVSETQLLSENGTDDRPDGSAVSDQLERLPSAPECNVPNSDNGAGTEEMQLNILERSLVKLEQVETSDTYVDPSGIHLSEKEVKREFSVDECNVLASSLCRLLNCWNAEPNAEMSDEKTVGVHSAESECAASVSSPAKKTTGSTRSNSTKTASNKMKSAMQLISRKCKYCHRLCSTRFNCQRHEAVCSSSMVLSSKCGVKKSRIKSKHAVHSQSRVSSSVRALCESNIFYCTKCGFSDSDHQVVNKHSKEPHDALRTKVYPGHDNIDSMKLSPGNFQCSFCRLHMNSRPRLLLHLQSHSSSVEVAGMHAVKQESLSDRVKVKSEEKPRGLTTASHARSCPKCSRSFSSTSLYLRHRAICRAIQRNKVIMQRPDRCNYLINFCELRPDGRWQCKVCKISTAYRGSVYRHIRKQHGKL